MGADIHAYLQIMKPGAKRPSSYGHIKATGGRNYAAFGLMAGVRGSGALFLPRGLPPEGLGFDADWDFWLGVNDDATLDGERFCSRDRATGWVNGGASIWDEASKNDDGSYRRVSDPDWHSVSWLNADELQRVIEAYAKQGKSDFVAERKRHDEMVAKEKDRFAFAYKEEDFTKIAELEMTIAAMRAAEKAGYEAKLCFWFDN